MATFTAVDVETADARHTQICAIGVVRVEGDHIVRSEHHLVRPTCPIAYYNQRTHGVTDAHVAGAKSFTSVWTALAPMFAGVDFLVAHNVPFDRSVLEKNCRLAGVPPIRTVFKDTMTIARAKGLVPSDLASVCARLGIPLAQHHHALCDAEASARVMLAFLRLR